MVVIDCSKTNIRVCQMVLKVNSIEKKLLPQRNKIPIRIHVLYTNILRKRLLVCMRSVHACRWPQAMNEFERSLHTLTRNARNHIRDRIIVYIILFI